MDVVLVIAALTVGAGLGALGMGMLTAQRPETQEERDARVARGVRAYETAAAVAQARPDEQARREQLAQVGVTDAPPTVRAHERCSCTHERRAHYGGRMEGACSVAYCMCGGFEHA